MARKDRVNALKTGPPGMTAVDVYEPEPYSMRTTPCLPRATWFEPAYRVRGGAHQRDEPRSPFVQTFRFKICDRIRNSAFDPPDFEHEVRESDPKLDRSNAFRVGNSEPVEWTSENRPQADFLYSWTAPLGKLGSSPPAEKIKSRTGASPMRFADRSAQNAPSKS